ncbi:MAG: SUMF1/EgtB/PvdO family nonheme iron enzyme [Cyanophyceae cyanobacterium]
MNYTSTRLTKDELLEALHQCRASTLELFADIDLQTFCQQAHADFSPVGWHLGHIAFTESYWILERCAGQPNAFPHYQQLFAADGLPKAERQNLPSPIEIQAYLEAVRAEVTRYLKSSSLEERLWRWLIQHESQHSETIAFILQLLRWRQSGYASLISPAPSSPSPTAEMIYIPAGNAEVGSNAIDALDNERPAYRIYLEPYWIDRYPVTCAQYREFMNAGGYQNRRWWSQAGWQWLQEHPVSQPLYWCEAPDWEHHPVCGVSWYEAEAYARFVGKRLPTEAEWERAAAGSSRRYPWGHQLPDAKRCNFNALVGHTTPVSAYPDGQSAEGCYDLLGNVWEWTASWFAAYAGFKSYPYQGYSQAYFDNQHRALRGGSWATRPWALRASFRNWYHPGVRQILAGFRCARNSTGLPED